jgi:hypothetical protein
MDVFGEEGEDAAHEEWRHGFFGVILFEGSGKAGEMPGNVACDAGGDMAGVEGERVKPNGAKAVAYGLARQFLELNAVGEGIRERDICLPGAGEVGEEF